MGDFIIQLATDRHQPSSETTAWQADETRIFQIEFLSSVKIRVNPWLNSAAFSEQIVNQLDSLLFRPARSKLGDASLHPPRPIRASCRARDIEAVVSGQEIRNHDDGNPGVALEKGLQDARIKAFFKIDFIAAWINAGEQGDFRQIESRLLRCGHWPFESLLP